MITKKVESCPRCGHTHEDMRFVPLSGADTAANYWAKCPTTKDPVMAKMELHVIGSWAGGVAAPPAEGTENGTGS